MERRGKGLWATRRNFFLNGGFDLNSSTSSLNLNVLSWKLNIDNKRTVL